MLDGINWVLTNIFASFGNVYWALTTTDLWLDFSSGESVMRLVYYGASVEFFFVILTTLLIITAVGVIFRRFLWGVVRGLEGFANFTGRVAAWAGLIMVIQQIVIVFQQRIFRVSQIEIGVGGYGFARDLSWWSEELKLYNAMIVALCVSYTFVQGGHVRVDLFYANVRFRTKKVIDMFGAMVFMMPVAIITWIYAWFFFWRVMIVPNPSASNTFEQLQMRARGFRWNIETIGFSPNGFDAYFLFKVLILAFVALTFIHAIAHFYRNLLEFIEGPESENKYLDKDTLGKGQEAYEGTH